MAIAFTFPGQGSQHIGMGKALNDAYPVARAVFEEADEALGQKLSAIMWDGELDELTLTENTQPALLVTSIAVTRVLKEQGLDIGKAVVDAPMVDVTFDVVPEPPGHEPVEVFPEDPAGHLGHPRAVAGGPVGTREARLGGVDHASQKEEDEGPGHRGPERPVGMRSCHGPGGGSAVSRLGGTAGSASPAPNRADDRTGSARARKFADPGPGWKGSVREGIFSCTSSPGTALRDGRSGSPTNSSPTSWTESVWPRPDPWDFFVV